MKSEKSWPSKNRAHNLFSGAQIYSIIINFVVHNILTQKWQKRIRLDFGETISKQQAEGRGEKKGDRGSGYSPGRRRPGDRRARRRTWPSSPCPTRLRQTNNPIKSRAAKPRRAKRTGAPYRNRPPGSAGTAAWPRRRRRGRSPTGPGATSARPRQANGTGQQVRSGIKKTESAQPNARAHARGGELTIASLR